MARKVLLIIDMLNDFIRPQGALYCGPGAEKIVAFIAQRLEAYRKAGQAVIFIQDCHKPDDQEFERFPAHCVTGTWGGRIIDELAPEVSDTVVPKTRYSGFFRTGLEKILAGFAPELVEVTGVCTSICVMDTVGGLANRNYRILVPRKGVADFDQRFHDFALERMEKLYGATVK